MHRTAILATVAALAIAPALAQQSTQPSPATPEKAEKSAQPMPDRSAQPSGPAAGQPSGTADKAAQPSASAQASATMKGDFISSQSPEQWLASKVIGLSVMDSQNQKIGSVDNLLITKDGKVVGAVIGVGGFLGIGQKDVGIPFEALNLTRDADGSERVTIQLTRQQLENAPDFKRYEPPRPAAQRPSPAVPGGKAPGGGN